MSPDLQQYEPGPATILTRTCNNMNADLGQFEPGPGTLNPGLQQCEPGPATILTHMQQQNPDMEMYKTRPATI